MTSTSNEFNRDLYNRCVESHEKLRNFEVDLSGLGEFFGIDLSRNYSSICETHKEDYVSPMCKYGYKELQDFFYEQERSSKFPADLQCPEGLETVFTFSNRH